MRAKFPSPAPVLDGAVGLLASPQLPHFVVDPGGCGRKIGSRGQVQRPFHRVGDAVLALLQPLTPVILGAEVRQDMADGVPVGGRAVDQERRVEAVVVITPRVAQGTVGRARPRIDGGIEQAVGVPTHRQDPVVQFVQRRFVGTLLVRTRPGDREIELRQPVDDLAVVIDESGPREIAGRMVGAEEVVVAQADRPFEITLPSGEPEARARLQEIAVHLQHSRRTGPPASPPPHASRSTVRSTRSTA